MMRYRYTDADFRQATIAAEETLMMHVELQQIWDEGLSQDVYLLNHLFDYKEDWAYKPIIQSGYSPSFSESVLSDSKRVLVSAALKHGHMKVRCSRVYYDESDTDMQSIVGILKNVQAKIAKEARPGTKWETLEDIAFGELMMIASGHQHTIGHWVHSDLSGKRIGLSRELDSLEEDDIIALAPGVYRKDYDLMARIEDCFVVTRRGAERLI